ncbi:MAG: protoheme IX farnesyltransferase [Nitrospiraceae bacterium]|nr:MAG: protoheme IX farnesyltransferase [Nitrospiraceae bacterium]
MIKIRTYIELCKVTLSFFSALSAATGFMLAGTRLTVDLAITVAGVFLLACGCCAFNQYQERDTDALMERTKGRPLPGGRILPFQAMFFSIVLITSGLLALIFTESLSAFLLGCCAVILYNGVYTYLKRKTAFASVPCAIIGALPPAIGWFAAGGMFPDRKILAVCLLFYIWQITHFWLLFLSHGEDYEKAGFPSLTRVFKTKQLERIVFMWMTSTSVASMLALFYGLITSDTTSFLLIPIALWLAIIGIQLLKGHGKTVTYQSAFARMNIYILLVMLLLSVDRIKFFKAYFV